MRINQPSNLANYKIKENALFLEVDYARFQTLATQIIQEDHDAESKQQWPLFC